MLLFAACDYYTVFFGSLSTSTAVRVTYLILGMANLYSVQYNDHASIPLHACAWIKINIRSIAVLMYSASLLQYSVPFCDRLLYLTITPLSIVCAARYIKRNI